MCDSTSEELLDISHSKVNQYDALAERLESNNPPFSPFISGEFHMSISAFYFGELVHDLLAFIRVWKEWIKIKLDFSLNK